jgi:multiple antibiotic resistance protein
MASLNFVDSFVTFLALLGPQKILLSFDQASRALPPRQARILAVISSAAAAAVGVACALTAPWLTSFFHISYPAVQLAALCRDAARHQRRAGRGAERRGRDYNPH